jgi:hypothetical protein
VSVVCVDQNDPNYDDDGPAIGGFAVRVMLLEPLPVGGAEQKIGV